MDLLRGFALVLMVSAALSIFIALYNGLSERRYDIAVMRTLGAIEYQPYATTLSNVTLDTPTGTSWTAAATFLVGTPPTATSTPQEL